MPTDTWLKAQIKRLQTTAEDVRLEVVRKIANLCRLRVEKHDPYTKEHSVRVATWSKVIANRLPTFDKERLYRLEITALVHDYGKIRVPHDVLNKTERLTPEEFESVKRHPELGADLLKPFADYVEMGGVLYHHVRYEGGGYPGGGGLSGNDIPLEARIIAVADTFDALTSDRSYRKGYPPKRAFEIMRGVSGKQLDPTLFGIFEEHWKAETQAKGYEVGTRTLLLQSSVHEEVKRARNFLRKHVGPYDDRDPLGKVRDKTGFVQKAIDDLQTLSVDRSAAEKYVRYAYRLPIDETFLRDDLALSEAEQEKLVKSLELRGKGHCEVILPLKRLRPEYHAVDVAVFHGMLWKCVGDGLKMVLVR